MSIESSPNWGRENPNKTEFFSSFAISNIEAMRLLKKFGLLGASGESKGEKAWGMLAGEERSFRNISEHCLVVGAVADVFLEKFVENEYLTSEERATGVKAAILHDLTKRKELEAMKGVEEANETFFNPKEQEGLKETFLQESGISDEDYDVISLSRFSGGGFVDLDPAEVHPLTSPESIIEWTIALSDWMVVHTHIVSVDDRIKEIVERGGYSEEYRWQHREFFGESGDTADKDDRTVIEEVFRKIYPILAKVEKEFKDALDIPQEESVADFVRSEFSERFSGESDGSDE